MPASEGRSRPRAAPGAAPDAEAAGAADRPGAAAGPPQAARIATRIVSAGPALAIRPRRSDMPGLGHRGGAGPVAGSLSVGAPAAVARPRRDVDRHRQAAAAQRLVGGRQRRHDGEALAAVAQRLLAGADAVHEVLALQSQRLLPVDGRDDDLTVAVRQLRFAGLVAGGILHAGVVD